MMRGLIVRDPVRRRAYQNTASGIGASIAFAFQERPELRVGQVGLASCVAPSRSIRDDSTTLGLTVLINGCYVVTHVS
jgi:hypothetical protein